jgi:rare lipoprotein A
MHRTARRETIPGRACTALFLLAIALTGCATLTPREPSYQEQGMASWYGPGFHGKTTSNKEVYDMHDMTAAHRTLPFGTHVMVTNMENGRTVIVRINDRGPFVKDRVIDLSYAAAQQLDMVGPGVVKVRVEVLPDRSPDPGTQRFSVQVGSFTVKSNASALQDSLKERYAGVYVSLYRTSRQAYYRVRIKADSIEAARATARKLQAEGYTVMVLEEQ